MPAAMRRSSQRGMTLIELLVAMVITSIILVALDGVFLNATSHYQEWANKIHSASIPVALATNLQADSHRYVVCGDHQWVYTLDLCPPDAMGSPAVRYQVSNTPPYMITRQSPITARATFLARGQTGQRPQFWADCFDAGDMVSGHIHVYNLRLGDGAGSNDPNNFMVYYAAPWTSSC